MKVEDALKLYEFLSQIHLLGFLAICLLVTLSVLLFIVPKEKLLNMRWLVLILLLAIVPLILLYTQSELHNKLKKVATNIKQDFAFKHYTQTTLRNLNIYTLNNKYESAGLLKLAYELEDQFPDEFLIVDMNINAADTLDKIGLCMIDSSVRRRNETAINDNALRTAEIARQLMIANNMDTIYINIDMARAHNDKYCLRQLNDEAWLVGTQFYTAMIGRSGLIPIYHPYMENGKITGYQDIIGFMITKEKIEIDLATQNQD